MSSGLISKTLDNPYFLTDTEQRKVAEIAKSFPYFVPARYVQAALQYLMDASPPVLYNAKELYVTNWLLFNECLQMKTGVQETPADAGQPATVAEGQPMAENPESMDIMIEETVEELKADKAAVNEDGEINELQITEPVREATEENLIQPVYTEDYFLHQGMQVSDDIPEGLDRVKSKKEEDPKSLMVMMSFSEWLMYFKAKKQQETEEEQERKALKTMWQKEKLAAALEEEGEEIPEDVFKMAVDSISREDELVSESLAEIHYKQGRYDKAIDMYNKLSLRNPGKKVYFARKIEEILKNK